MPVGAVSSFIIGDHELLIAKFTLKLKKVQKTTRPFRYDLNQILYDYTVEGLMLKLHYFGHFMQRVDSLEMTLMLGRD